LDIVTRSFGGPVDKPEYDRPDDEDSTGSKALIFLVLAIVVVAIFYFGIYR
jgi:hypothetical protein